MKALPIQFDESIPAWEKAIYAFLAEKQKRSGSMRTVDAYTRTLQHFFGTLGKTPEQVTPPDVFGFAHGIGPSGKEPAAITIGARLRLYLVVLPVPDPHGDRCSEPLRPA